MTQISLSSRSKSIPDIPPDFELLCVRSHKLEGQIDYQECHNTLREMVDYLRGCSEALLQSDQVESDATSITVRSRSDLQHIRNATSSIDGVISQLLELLENHIDDSRTVKLLESLQSTCDLSGQLKELLSIYEARLHISTLFDDLYNGVLGEIDLELDRCLSLSRDLKTVELPVDIETSHFLEKLKTCRLLSGNPPAFDDKTQNIYMCYSEVLQRYTPIAVSISLAHDAIQSFQSQTSTQHEECFEKLRLRLAVIRDKHSQLSGRMNALHQELVLDTWQAILDQLVRRTRDIVKSDQNFDMEYVASLLKQIPEENHLKDEARNLYTSIQQIKFSNKSRFPFNDVVNTTPLPFSRLKRASSFANALKPIIEPISFDVNENGLSEGFKMLNLNECQKSATSLSSPLKLNNRWSTSSIPISRTCPSRISSTRVSPPGISPTKISPTRIPTAKSSTVKTPSSRTLSRIPQRSKTPTNNNSSPRKPGGSSPIHLEMFRASLCTFPQREGRRKSMIPVPNSGHCHSPKFPSAFSTPNMSSRKFANSSSDGYF